MEFNKSITSRFSNSTKIGNSYEDLAAAFLTSQGLTLIQRNYRCKCGEIDLIMRKQNTLVFVEVKYRKNNKFGGAISALSHKQMQRLMKSAQYFLNESNSTHLNARFDVVAITGSSQPVWIQNAIFSEG